MKVTIHQPEHLVWLGLVDKVAQADMYIVLDSVQFRKNYFQNRNRVRTQKGCTWVTVPVQHHALVTPINQIHIAEQTDWRKKYLGIMQEAYRKSDFFDEVFPIVSRVIGEPYVTLSELNMALIQTVFPLFGVTTPMVYSSDMVAAKSGDMNSDLILSLCREVGATQYLSGPSGRDYLHVADFEKAGIEVLFHSFEHPIYTQVFEPFIPGMSSIDLLFNHGREGSRQILFRNL